MHNPLEMVISLSLHPMKALAVENHGLPSIIGCPLEGSFDSTTMTSIGYSHEDTDTTMSSRTLTGFIVVRSVSSRIEGVGWRNCPGCKTYKTVVVIILIADPKSIRVFYMEILFTITVTIGLPGFVYFAILDWSVIHSDISSIT